MTDFGVRFYPIPRTSPIPRNVVGLVGGVSGVNPSFLLSLNGTEIVIQAPTDPPGFGTLDDFDKDDPFHEWHVTERCHKVFGHYLEIIQTLLPEIEFGKTNWAYLTYQNRGGPGGYQITQRNRRSPRVTCPPWGRMIHENEIEYTVFGLASDRRGIWNGKEVDVMVGWDESHLDDVDRSMYGYRLLEGMDLTFEFYGHLIGSNGEIKGIVAEAAWGRMITADDFTKVYRAIARVQRRGLLYRACLTNRFMIANNKLRLLDLAMVDPRFVAKPSELEKQAEAWHWLELSRLFQEIKTIGPYGDYRIPFRRFVTSYDELECLPFPPTPERPMGGIMLPPDFFRGHCIEPWPEYADIWDKDKKNASEELQVEARRKDNRHPSNAIFFLEMETNLPTRSIMDEDRPLPVSRLQNRAQRRLISYPYGVRPAPRQKLLLGSEDTNSSDDVPVATLISRRR